MNKYYKYCPNVYVAQCTEKHEKGEIIEIETKYGKINEHIVFNLIAESNNFYFYSIVRADGFDRRAWLERKIERLENASANQHKKSEQYYNKSNEHRDFLVLGEPIKVGHHSEKRHRKMIESANNNMRKFVEATEKAGQYEDKAENLKTHLDDINLSMPESLEYFETKLKEAAENYEMLKEHPEKRKHALSLTYAKKAVNELKKKLEIAKKLWG